MGIHLTALKICAECPHFVATAEVLQSDNIAYDTELRCVDYSKCKRAFYKGAKHAAEQISQAGGEEDDRVNY